MLEEVLIDKIVAGGQGIGTLGDGRKVFVWGVLPGELALVRVYKKKKDYAEAVVEKIIKPSSNRIESLEPLTYLANSPWQIVDFDTEAKLKEQILREVFSREGLEITWQDFYQNDQAYNYRNKMEYNFWFDKETDRLDLAIHARASHRKIAVKISQLASESINQAGINLVNYLNHKQIAGRDIKSVILRSSQTGETGISLFIKNKELLDKLADFSTTFALGEVVFSDPKSPASVVTSSLSQSSSFLSDKLLGRNFRYSVRSFFQVNIPVYEEVLKMIATYVNKSGLSEVIDLYSGVGSIGLSVVSDSQQLTLVDISQDSIDQALINIEGRPNCHAVAAKSEDIVDLIKPDSLVILDPPRAGLHPKVIAKILESKPPLLVYLSCNPTTQARDLKLLLEAGYLIQMAKGYNFFPRTPHIESLVILRR